MLTYATYAAIMLGWIYVLPTVAEWAFEPSPQNQCATLPLPEGCDAPSDWEAGSAGS